MLVGVLLWGGVSQATPLDTPPDPDTELGIPFLRTFTPRHYDSHPQNWAVAQDPRGVLFFGNTDGVLEFDGDSWRRVRVDNGSIVRSLAIADDGTVHVGAIGELGRLRPDATGQLAYESLVDELPEEHREFSDVWRTLATHDAVFYWTPGKLFRWRDQQFRVFEVANRLIPAVLGDRLLINLEDRGLHRLEGDDFEPIPGGEALAGQRIDLILPGPAGGLFLGSRAGRLQTLSSHEDGPPRLAPFETEAQPHLDRHQLYTGVLLPDGSYALGTMTGGVVILDRRGRVRHRLDSTTGLNDDSVWATAVDRQGGLWLGLNRGLARIETRTPITVFDANSGLEGTVETVVRHRGVLHAGTSTGVYRLEGQRFVPVSRDFGLCWSLVSVPAENAASTLLAGSYGGVFELSEGESRAISNEGNVFTLYPRRDLADQVLAGRRHGLGLLRRIDGRWTDAGAIAGIDDEVRSLAQDSKGWLWVGTLMGGVYRLRLDDEGRKVEGSLSHWGREQGLPGERQIKILPFGNRLLFATPEGLFGLEAGARRIEPSLLLGSALASGPANVNRLATDPEGNLWLTRVAEHSPILARRRGPNRFEIRPLPFDRLPGSVWLSLLPEAGGIAWLGGPDGLYRFDANAEIPAPRSFDTLIREVSRRDGTLLYGGLLPPSSGTTEGRRETPEEPSLPFEDNDLSVHYALTSFGTDSRREFRHRLDGLDDSWSTWSVDSKVEYRNLREGRYTFQVQGRDLSGNLGSLASYAFQIEPPWFRTAAFRWSALLALGVLAWSIQGMLVARIRHTQRSLAEEEQNAEREQLIALLQAKNADLERFSYTVSHDLKAPLVTIRGFLGLLGRDLDRGKTHRVRSDLERIDSAAAKMQARVEKLLQLSRLGRKLAPGEPVALSEVVGEALELVSGELEAGAVEVVVESDLPTLHCDRGRLVEALQNLLQNAVKYMGGQDTPRITVGARSADRPVVVTVGDNGIGIDPDHHEEVFQLFQRVDHSVDGTGIGLALVRGICEAHGGTAWVESEGAGQGSTFCMTFAPTGDAQGAVSGG